MNFSSIKHLGKSLLTIGIENIRRTLIPIVQMSSNTKTYETIAVTVPKPFVYHVELNRPEKLNAINTTLWFDIGKCFNDLAVDENCRSVVLSGAGRLFSAGIDLNDVMNLGAELAEQEDVARKSKVILKYLIKFQDSLTAMEKCNKPIISAVHGPCVGGGVEIIVCSDIRYCTNDAWFQVKEVDIGMAADVGTLQRLPKVIGSSSLVRELCYTARKMHAPEALNCGFVSKIFDTKESMINGAIELAAEIASKSPVAVQGTKFNLIYSRDHTVQEGLDHIANHNKSMLLSKDFIEAATAQAIKEPNIEFDKL